MKTKISKWILGAGVLILTALVAVFFVFRATPPDLNDQELLAFRKCFGLGDQFSHVQEVADIALLKLHRVYDVSGFNFPGKLYPPAHCVAAVGNDRKSFKLPEDFNKVMLRENLSVETVDAALLVAETYTRLSSVPGRPVILKDYTQIPAHQGSVFPDPSQFASLITPPEVSTQSGSYSVSFYTWKRVGGLLEKWSFIIKQSGVIEVDTERIERRVGDFILLI